MYKSGVQLPKVAFSSITYSNIPIGSYFFGFDLDNSGKLSKMDHNGTISVIEEAADVSLELSVEISNRIAQDTSLESELSTEISSLAEADELTIELDTLNNVIRLKETVAAPGSGTRTFEGDIIVDGEVTLGTIGSNPSVSNLGVDIDGKIVNGSNGSQFQYEIGEYVPDHGGVIFHRYLDGTNENYLVVSITDQSTGQAWSNVSSTLIGLTAQSTWDGLSNSNAIVGQVGFTDGAAKTCLDLVSLGKDDWYLPAIDELSLLWQNKFNVNRTLSGNSSYGVIPGAAEIGYNYYWSSTEFESSFAFFFFNNGVVGDYNKDGTNYVRAVRKFSVVP